MSKHSLTPIISYAVNLHFSVTLMDEVSHPHRAASEIWGFSTNSLGSKTFRPDMSETVPTILLPLMVLVSSQSSSSLWLSLYYLLTHLEQCCCRRKAQKAQRHVAAAGSLVTALSGAMEQEVSAVACVSNLGVTENPTLKMCLLISSFISDCRWNYVTKWTTLSTTLEMLHFYKHWPVTLLVHTTPFSSGSLGTDTPYIMQKCHKL
jgi:hypothetical protein